MLNASRTFRVFVSSTFADLVEERNALQRGVWPELAKLCEKAGFRFQAIDLRWGVPSEAALDQRTSRICLDELKRCQVTSPRPNFIILLGNRYGWRPLPEEIEAKEFEAIAAKAQSLELDESLLRKWYRLDTNAVPAVYYLRPRRQDTDEANGSWWTDNVEQPLRNLFLQCIDALWAKDDPRRIDYERSLTEREIMAGALNPSANDARDHVFAYFREVDYLDSVIHVDEAEAKHLRPFVDFTKTTECDTTARQLHQNLKKNLEATLGHQHVRKFDATWTGVTVSQDHLEQLCDAVLNDLRGVIEAEIRKFEEKPPLEVEISAHEEFAKLRGGYDDSGQSRFQGRAENLNVIAEYVCSTETNRPLVIYGPAGSGKSALMAKAALDADQNFPNAIRLRRFIGVTPSSVDARSLLQSLCEELGQKFQNTTEVPLEYRELVSAFRERLGWATADRPVVVFLDAVDQLSESDNARSLVWLPRQLPPHVRLVVSVLNDPLSSEAAPGTKSPTNSDPFETLKRRDKNGELLHQIGDYPEHDAEALLVHWLRADNRTLTADQQSLVLNRFTKCPRPLFLKLAAEEAKHWRSDTTIVKMPTAEAPDDMLSAIINQLFDRLSEPSNHGERLVERAIGYLVASKNGLTEDELLGLLSTDKEFFDDFVDRAIKVNQPLPTGIDSLPVAVWVRLYSDLQPYLTTRRADGTTLLAFYHRSLKQTACKRFLSNPEIAGRRHEHIANCFKPAEPHGFFRLTLDEQLAWARKLPPEPRPVNIRMVMELPYQLLEVAKLLGKDDAKSPHWDAVADLLLSIHFLEAKAECFLFHEISNDFRQALADAPVDHSKYHLFKLIAIAISRNLGFVIRHAGTYPQGLFQCIWNLCWWYDSPQAAVHFFEPQGGWEPDIPWLNNQSKLYQLLDRWRLSQSSRGSSCYWLRARRPPHIPLTSSLRSDLRAVTNCGAYSHREDSHRASIIHPVSIALASDANRLIVGYHDATARVWCTSTLTEVQTIRLTPYRRRDNWRKAANCVSGVAISSDGTIAATAHHGSVSLWNIDNGECIHHFPWSDGWITCVAISADGYYLAYGTIAGTLCLIRVRDFCRMWAHKCQGWVASVAISHDNNRVAAAFEKTGAIIFDITSGDAIYKCPFFVEWERTGFPTSDMTPCSNARLSGNGSLMLVNNGREAIVVDYLTHSEKRMTFEGQRLTSAQLLSKTKSLMACSNGTCLICENGSGKVLTKINLHSVANSVVMDESMGLIFAAHWDSIGVYEPAPCFKHIPHRIGHSDALTGLAVNTDGKEVITSGLDFTVRTWDILTGQCTSVISERSWRRWGDVPMVDRVDKEHVCRWRLLTSTGGELAVVDTQNDTIVARYPEHLDRIDHDGKDSIWAGVDDPSSIQILSLENTFATF